MSNTRRAHISSSSLRTSIAALAVVVVSSIVAIPAAHAQTFTVLYTFTGGSDGSLPTTGLVKDAAGNLYGTTFRNGDPSCNVLFGSCGVVFKLDPSGSFTVLHSFVGKSDGAGPRDLIGDASGALSGVTDNGGVRDCPAGCGVIFKVESGGTFIPLYSFTGFPDGRTPKSLTSDSAGNLYGITQLGGAFGSGSVFEFDSSGHESILYSFRGGANGSAPRGPLARDAAGNLYGTTTEGGDLSCGGGSGCGTAYKLTPTGEKTIIRRFHGGVDGSFPLGLVLGPDGNLYGVTGLGGSAACGCGTLFKLAPTGKFTVLHLFRLPDGTIPTPIVIDSAGNIYGANHSGGGPRTGGTVWKFDNTGTFTVLHRFVDPAGGFGPIGRLLVDADGNIYGTDSEGGNLPSACGGVGCGVVFKITP